MARIKPRVEIFHYRSPSLEMPMTRIAVDGELLDECALDVAQQRRFEPYLIDVLTRLGIATRVTEK